MTKKIFILNYLIFSSLFSHKIFAAEKPCLFLQKDFSKNEKIAELRLAPEVFAEDIFELRIKKSSRANNNDYGFFLHKAGEKRWVARMITKIIILPQAKHLHFIGMEIKKELRGFGLSKILVKTLILFAKENTLSFTTGRLKKPALVKVLCDLGLSPVDPQELIHIRKSKNKEGLYPVYLEKTVLEKRFLKSQSLVQLAEKPEGQDFKAYPYLTTFKIVDEASVRDKLEELLFDLVFVK